MPGIHLVKDNKFRTLYEDISEYLNHNFKPENSNFFNNKRIKKNQDPQLTQLKINFEYQSILGDSSKIYNFFVVDRKNKNSLLHIACKEGNNLLVRFLLNAGLNINHLNTYHESSLYLACLHQQEEIVDLLLNSGANGNAGLVEAKKIPLYITLDPENNDLTESEKIKAANILKKLMDKGVDINQQLGRRSRFVPIHYAVMDRRKLLVQTIVKSGKADLSLTDVDGRTALHMVADYRSPEDKVKEAFQMKEEKQIIELIIPNVDSISKQDKWGNTPLHIAVINSNVDVVATIVKKDYLFPQLKILNIKNNNGRTALHEAVLEAHRGPKILDLLVQLATQDELAIKSDVIQNGYIFTNKGHTALEMANDLLAKFQRKSQLLSDLVTINTLVNDFKTSLIYSEPKNILYEKMCEINQKLEKMVNFVKIDDRLKNLSKIAFDISINTLLPDTTVEEIKSLADILSKKIDSLQQYIHTNINANYQQGLITAKNTLEQTEYFKWKNQQLNIESSFPELTNNVHESSLLEAANKKYIQAHSFFSDNRIDDAKICLKESVDYYDAIKNYVAMEKAYEFLALIYINSGSIKEYEAQNQAIFRFPNLNDKAKLHAHLALAGFYKALKNHNLSLLFPVSNDDLYAHESYHYSEAYKLTQGNLDNQAHVVLQREMGIGNKVKLGTYNIQQCIAVVAHDPHSGKIVLAHFDRFSGPIKFIENILREFPNIPKINLYLTGARDRYTTVSPTSTTKVSDNNVDQVFKQIFSNRDRFNILATDVGDKLSPEAVVFNFETKKLEHKMPHRADPSLNSRAAMMSVQIDQKNGDYLLPLEKVDFNRGEGSRKRIFSNEQRQLIEQSLESFKEITDVSEAWKHDQLIQPLLAIKQATNNLPINYQQGLFANLAINENIFDAQPSFDKEDFYRQQRRQQSPDFINILYTQNLLSPSTSSFNEINTQGIEDDLEHINIQPPRKKICLQGIQKREIGLCSIYEEELRNFIVNKQEDQEVNHENIIIDSEAFLKHLKSCDSEKQSELIRFAETFQITGNKQFVLKSLIYNEKLKFHVKKMSKISSGLSNSLVYEGALTDLFHGDFDTAIQLGGLNTFGQILNQASNKLNILSQKWIAEGKWLRGQFLRASTPFLSRSTSLFSIFNIVKDVKMLKSTNNIDQYTEAMVDMVSNDVYVGLDLVETGVEITEVSFESLALGISAVTGPLDEIIGVCILLGDRVYEAVEKTKHENELIQLTGWEKFKEGFRGFLDIKPEAYIQKEMDEATEYNTHILPKAWDWLTKHKGFKYIILPAIEEIGQRSRVVKVPTTCTYGDRIFKACLVSQTIQDPIFAEIKNNRAYFHHKFSGFWKTQYDLRAPLGSKLFCIPMNNPATGQYVDQNQPEILCRAAIALKKINGTGKAFFNLGTGTDYIQGFKNISNVMLVSDGAKDYEGGDQDDIFILDAKKVISVTLEGNKGGIDGREGEDTLLLQKFHPSVDRITVNFREEKLKYANQTLDIVSIEKLIGGSIPLSIEAACGSREIHTQGNNDIIWIPASECPYAIKMYFKSNTTVKNYATQGDFIYSIFNQAEGCIVVNIDGYQSVFDRSKDLFSTHQFLLNDNFLNIRQIFSDFSKLNQVTGTYPITFHLLNSQSLALLDKIQSISIINTFNGGYINYQFDSEKRPPSMFETSNLPVNLNKTQVLEIFNEKDVRSNYLDWDNFNLTLSNKHHIKYILVKLLEDSNSSLIKNDCQLEVNTRLTETLSFHFLDNSTIKIGNNNTFLFHTSSESVETILSIYKPLAYKLNLISTIHTDNNESIIIGHRGHEVMNYNPNAFKTHLDGNGGESLFVIDARPNDLRSLSNLPSDLRSLSNGFLDLGNLSHLPLNEVILYHGYDRHVNTLDLRPLVAQFQTESMGRLFKMVFVPPTEENNLNNDLLLLFTIQNLQIQKTIIPIRLKDAILTDWHLHYLHIIIHVAPQKIIGTLDHLKLQPIPLQFDKKHKIISITAQDVEENTMIYVPAMEEISFFRDGNHLRITNIFNLSKSVPERTILLINYFNEPKLSTLIIKFPNNEIILSSRASTINLAPHFQERFSAWQKAFDTVVFNQTTASVGAGILSTENQIALSEEADRKRSSRPVRSIANNFFKNAVNSQVQIDDKSKNVVSVPALSQSHSPKENYLCATGISYENFFLVKLFFYVFNRISIIKGINKAEKLSTQIEQPQESDCSLKNLEVGKAKYGPRG